MLRGLFTIPSAVSLALCVATCALWAWSRADRAVYTWSHWSGLPGRPGVTAVTVGGGAGRAWVRVFRFDPRTPADAGPLQRLLPGGFRREPLTRNALDGMAWMPRYAWSVRADRGPSGRSREWRAHAPAWVLAAVLAALPALWFDRRRHRRLRRLRGGLCLARGYDLRATPERCPECGAVPADVRPV